MTRPGQLKRRGDCLWGAAGLVRHPPLPCPGPRLAGRGGGVPWCLPMACSDGSLGPKCGASLLPAPKPAGARSAPRVPVQTKPCPGPASSPHQWPACSPAEEAGMEPLPLRQGRLTGDSRVLQAPRPEAPVGSPGGPTRSLWPTLSPAVPASSLRLKCWPVPPVTLAWPRPESCPQRASTPGPPDPLSSAQTVGTPAISGWLDPPPPSSPRFQDPAGRVTPASQRAAPGPENQAGAPGGRLGVCERPILPCPGHRAPGQEAARGGPVVGGWVGG